MPNPDGYPCRRCGVVNTDPVFKLRESGPHYGEYVCAFCQAHIKFVAKPEAKKSKRESKHRLLAKKYGRGFCEMCLSLEQHLNSGEALEGHHVLEYDAHDGGSDRDNVWVLCTSCHEMVSWIRRNAKRSRGEGAVYATSDNGEGSSGIEESQAMGQLEGGADEDPSDAQR